MIKSLQRRVAMYSWDKEESIIDRIRNKAMRSFVEISGLSGWYVLRILNGYETNSNVLTKIFISFDCDLEEDVKAYYRLVEKMERYDLTGSFACIGSYVEKFPDEHRALVEAGHEIINHSMTHPHHRLLNPDKRFNLLSDDEMRQEIILAHEVIEGVLGVRCVGFRTPHFGGLHTRSIYPILEELGYWYSSSTIATRAPNLLSPFEENGILEIPLTPSLRNAFTCPETWAIWRSQKPRYRSEKDYLEEIREILKLGVGNIELINFYFDPCDMACKGLADSIFETIAEYQDKANIMRYRDYAKQKAPHLCRASGGRCR